jgi:formylmethanofuran dehydrogenase subunit E
MSAFCNYVVLSVVPEDGEAGGRLEGIVLLDAEAELVLQVRAERHSQQEPSGRQQEFQHEKEHNQAEILRSTFEIQLVLLEMWVAACISLCFNFSRCSNQVIPQLSL